MTSLSCKDYFGLTFSFTVTGSKWINRLIFLLALATKAREYSSLRDFGPYIIDLFLYEDLRGFMKDVFWLVLKLEISYRAIISWRILVSFRGFFEDYIFPW